MISHSNCHTDVQYQSSHDPVNHLNNNECAAKHHRLTQNLKSLLQNDKRTTQGSYKLCNYTDKLILVNMVYKTRITTWAPMIYNVLVYPSPQVNLRLVCLHWQLSQPRLISIHIHNFWCFCQPCVADRWPRWPLAQPTMIVTTPQDENTETL